MVGGGETSLSWGTIGLEPRAFRAWAAAQNPSCSLHGIHKTDAWGKPEPECSTQLQLCSHLQRTCYMPVLGGGFPVQCLSRYRVLSLHTSDTEAALCSTPFRAWKYLFLNLVVLSACARQHLKGTGLCSMSSWPLWRTYMGSWCSSVTALCQARVGPQQQSRHWAAPGHQWGSADLVHLRTCNSKT